MMDLKALCYQMSRNHNINIQMKQLKMDKAIKAPWPPHRLIYCMLKFPFYELFGRIKWGLGGGVALGGGLWSSKRSHQVSLPVSLCLLPQSLLQMRVYLLPAMRLMDYPTRLKLYTSPSEMLSFIRVALLLVSLHSKWTVTKTAKLTDSIWRAPGLHSPW